MPNLRGFSWLALVLATPLAAACGGDSPQTNTGGTATISSTTTGAGGATSTSSTTSGDTGGSGGSTTGTGGAAGLVFVPENSGVSASLHDAWSFGDGEAYAVGAEGTVLHRKNGSWTAETSGTTEFIDTIWAASKTILYAGGGDTFGLVLRSTGDGVWTPETLPAGTTRVLSVWGSAGDDVYALTFDILLHRDAGGTWATVPGAPSNSFRIWVPAPDEVYVTGFGSVNHLLAGVWSEEPTPCELMYDVCGLGEEAFFVAEHGASGQKVGGVWESVFTTVFEPIRCRFAKQGSVFVFGINEATAPVRQGLIGNPGAAVEGYTFPKILWGGAASAGDVIAVGEEGTIYRAALP